MIRVLLADDDVLVRSGLRALLDAERDITVVGEAADGREAVERAHALQPDVVLMDVRMPGWTVSRRPGRSWHGPAGRGCSS